MAIKKRNKKWVVDFYVGGRTGRRLRRSFDTKVEAMEFEQLTTLRRVDGLTLSLLIEKYKALHDSANEESTQKRNKAILERVLEHLGDGEVSQVGFEDIQTYKAYRLAQVKPVTVNIELRVIRSLFNRAVEWGYLVDSPAKRVTLLKLEEQPINVLSPEEGAKVIEVATGQMKTFIAMGLYTGMRRMEMFSLVWDDVDLVGKTIVVRKSKSKKMRTLPINSHLCELLERHPRHISSRYVFHSPGGNKWVDPRKGFEQPFTDAGLEIRRMHDLRHSFVSNLVRNGVDLRTVKELAGHASINTTMLYAHLAEGQTRTAIERLNWSAKNKKKRKSG